MGAKVRFLKLDISADLEGILEEVALETMEQTLDELQSRGAMAAATKYGAINQIVRTEIKKAKNKGSYYAYVGHDVSSAAFYLSYFEYGTRIHKARPMVVKVFHDMRREAKDQ